jgi:hypothetical protein
MPWYRINGMAVHMKLAGPKSKHPKPCVARIPAIEHRAGTVQCQCISTFLCDWKLSDGSTCDAPLCPDHAHQVEPDVHLCPTHLAEKRGSEPELF